MDKYFNKSENVWTTRSVKKFSEDNMLTQKNKMHQKGLAIPSVNQKAWRSSELLTESNITPPKAVGIPEELSTELATKQKPSTPNYLWGN